MLLCALCCLPAPVFAATPAALAFSTQPGITITPSVTVLVKDNVGVTVTDATNAVTLAIGTNPGGSTLAGTLTVSAVNGVATFPDLALNQPGNGYTVTAAATGLTGATI